MKKVNNLLILLLVGILLILTGGINEFTVVYISIGLVAMAVALYAKNKLVSIIITAGVLAAGLIYSEFLYFAIILMMLLVDFNNMFSVIGLSLPPIFALTSGNIELFLNIVIFCIVALSITYLDFKYTNLKEKYDSYHDMSRQRQLELTVTNNFLTESQNHSIKIALLEERNRIARDIHDGVGHLISRAILQLGALIVTETDALKKEPLVEIKDSLSYSMDEIRNSVHNLVEEDTDLELLLKGVVDNFDFCDLNYIYELSFKGDLNFNYSILYIIKESLNNIMVHSNATKAEIALRETKDNIYLLIKDNGDNPKVDKLGLGLVSIRERINAMDGNIEISTKDGFRIFITLRKDKL